jgi:hypothetical protein
LDASNSLGSKVKLLIAHGSEGERDEGKRARTRRGIRGRSSWGGSSIRCRDPSSSPPPSAVLSCERRRASFSASSGAAAALGDGEAI